MKKRNTVYEDKAEKEEKRRQKRMEHIQKHVVLCPHCGQEVLDHMTKCPHCNGELTPRGYKPMDEKLQRRIKLITTAVLAVVAVAIVLVILLTR